MIRVVPNVPILVLSIEPGSDLRDVAREIRNQVLHAETVVTTGGRVLKNRFTGTVSPPLSKRSLWGWLCSVVNYWRNR